jgi:hypothetical protein
MANLLRHLVYHLVVDALQNLDVLHQGHHLVVDALQNLDELLLQNLGHHLDRDDHQDVVVHLDESDEVFVKVLASRYRKDYFQLRVVADVAWMYRKDYFHQVLMLNRVSHQVLMVALEDLSAA